MKRCVKCLLPETKPGLKFNDAGVCSACQHVEAKKNIDYELRRMQLHSLCNKYRKGNGEYDCIIPVSGGKDSTFQTYMMKDVMHMNPLLVSVTDDFEHTQAGTHNYLNLSNTFNCDMITLKLASQFNRKMTRWGFENIGSSNWAVDKAIYAWPLQMAIKFGIKLIVYGEDVTWEYGGVLENETFSAKHQIYNDVVRNLDIRHFAEAGCTKEEMNMTKYPEREDIEVHGLEPIFLSYFVQWDWLQILKTAQNYGFKTLKDEWCRCGYADDFIQIDSCGYLFNYYLKFCKLGWSQTTHFVSDMIRWGHMTKEQGARLIDIKEGALDERIVSDFERFTGYSQSETHEILDKWYNRDLFEKSTGIWKLKEENLAVNG